MKPTSGAVKLFGENLTGMKERELIHIRLRFGMLFQSGVFFFFQAEDGIRDFHVTGVPTCALPICLGMSRGTPGYPGGSPRGSVGEAGPMPPRPLRLAGCRAEGLSCRSARQKARAHQEF